MNDLISVIIPYYNGEDYICECLDSIYSQTFQNFEIILVNDGSPKEFLEDLKINKYPDLILYHQDNKGQSVARNKGFEIAKGKYILFVDCDDKISDTFLEKTYAVLLSNTRIRICYTKSQYFEKETTEWDLPDFEIKKFLFSNCIPISALLYKEDFIKANGFDENLTYFEDWDLWISIIENGGEVYRIPENLFYYRIRHNANSLTNISTQQEEKIAQNRLFIYQNHYQFYAKHGFNFTNISYIILDKAEAQYKKKYYNVWYRKLKYKLFKPEKFKEIYGSL